MPTIFARMTGLRMEIRGTGAMRGLGGGILWLPGAEGAPGDVQVRGAPERGQRRLWRLPVSSISRLEGLPVISD